MVYKHLGENERFVIELMLSKGSSRVEIAKLLGYCRQTIKREIDRNSDKDGIYRAQRAQDLSVVRREYPKQESKLSKLTDENMKLIADMLRERSSPRSNK